MADVVFIGAGPVGLYTAIQLKLYCPELDIRMYEKYEEYQRKHVLIVDKSSYKGSHPDSDFQALLSELTGTVPTNVIEDKLLDFARSLGIEIKYQPVESVQKLAEENPETGIIIGSDGSHSLLRKELFDDKKIVEEDLQYIAELKYKVRGTSRALSSLMEYIPALTLTNHFVSEHVGKIQEGETPISIRFFIDEETFREMQSLGVSFKNPLNLERAKCIEEPGIANLSTSIQRWLVARNTLANDVIIEGSDKITAINLPVYRSELFAKEQHGKKWFLVGDSALGVPYFRALNAGLLSANQLAKLLDLHFHPENKPEKSKLSSFAKISSSLDQDRSVVELYNQRVSSIADSEIQGAKLKNLGVSTAITSTHSMQKAPVSSLKLPVETRRDMKAINPEPHGKISSCSMM
ncbi:NAD(P)/FAD-dependent oxidoreductase [Legionella spiritensis]|uniref:Uncharacterized protein n=1 Tax=Legionella spiritensis TaxID=452 RepID=A0A0W0Z8B9_LEGSP|nr:hypothetical protein [Legionella spiritensis]KTD65355.1 hypothetical protein Lspi_0672 [Legionella spiritensis]SNV47326.1 Uncharacterised protein [Legionella spiritensis]